jgi:hypothetical protein
LELKPGLQVGCAIAYQKKKQHKSSKMVTWLQENEVSLNQQISKTM